jgi:hypothetical protein
MNDESLSANANTEIAESEEAIKAYGDAVRAHEKADAAVLRLTDELRQATADRDRKEIKIEAARTAIYFAEDRKDRAVAARTAREKAEAAAAKKRGES